MDAHFDDYLMPGEDEEGQPIYFDWLRAGDAAPVRVEVKEDYAKEKWDLPWTDQEAITRAFNQIKGQHVAAAPGSRRSRYRIDYRVYTLK